jgi:hypothetical protein
MATALSYKKEVIAPNTTVFMFDKIYDYNDFIEQKSIELPKISANAKRVYDSLALILIRLLVQTL